MEYSDAKSLVDEHIGRFVDYLGLNQWRIVIEYERLDIGNTGQCEVNATYMWAVIRLDPEQYDGIEQLLRTLRHELIHVFLWAMHEHAHTLMAMPSDADAAKALDRVWSFYLERQVREIEMLLDRNGQCPVLVPGIYKAKGKKK